MTDLYSQRLSGNSAKEEDSGNNKPSLPLARPSQGQGVRAMAEKPAAPAPAQQPQQPNSQFRTIFEGYSQQPGFTEGMTEFTTLVQGMHNEVNGLGLPAMSLNRRVSNLVNMYRENARMQAERERLAGPKQPEVTSITQNASGLAGVRILPNGDKSVSEKKSPGMQFNPAAMSDAGMARNHMKMMTPEEVKGKGFKAAMAELLLSDEEMAQANSQQINDYGQKAVDSAYGSKEGGMAREDGVKTYGQIVADKVWGPEAPSDKYSGSNPVGANLVAQPPKPANTGVPTEDQVITDSIDNHAKAMYQRQQVQQMAWYDSDSFNRGLVRFGLGLLSGEDYATAFDNAAKDFDAGYAIEQREQFRDELITDGYTPASVQDWIQGQGELVEAASAVGPEWSNTRTDAFGMYQTNLQTNERKYIRDADDFGLGGSGGSGGAGGYGGYKSFPEMFTTKSNVQVGIGTQVMDPALELWDNEWQQSQLDGTYPMMETTDMIWDRFEAAGNTLDPTDWKGAIWFNDRQKRALAGEKRAIEAYGRILSGGAIKDEEWKNWGNTLFPRMEDRGNPMSVLHKQFMRHNVALAMSRLANRDDYRRFQSNDPAEQTRHNAAMFNEALNEVAQAAKHVVAYDPESGTYELQGGVIWHPRRGRLN